MKFLFLFVFLVVHVIARSECNGIGIYDLSEQEESIHFTHPDETNGTISYFIVVNDKENIIKEYDQAFYKKRVLEYSKSQCVPLEIKFPDVQLIEIDYKDGIIHSKRIFENGGKLLAKEFFYDKNQPMQINTYKMGLIQKVETFLHHGGKKSLTKYDNNRSVESVLYYNDFGAVDSILSATDNTYKKFFANNGIGDLTYFDKDQKITLGFDTNEKPRYKVVRNLSDEIEKILIYSQEKVQHLYEKKNDQIVQSEWYPNGVLKLSSTIDTQGNETIRYFEKFGKIVKLLITLDKDKTPSLIYLNPLNPWEDNYKCELDDKKNYVCGAFEWSGTMLARTDTSLTFEKINNSIKKNNFMKQNLAILINSDLPDSLFQKENKKIIKALTYHYKERGCYDLGFMEYCQ